MAAPAAVMPRPMFRTTAPNAWNFIWAARRPACVRSSVLSVMDAPPALIFPASDMPYLRKSEPNNSRDRVITRA